MEEQNLEELENINSWYLDDLIEHPSKLEHVLGTIVSVVLSQQKEIAELKQYIEDQKREARLASEDWN
jgi:hypothetical protein